MTFLMAILLAIIVLSLGIFSWRTKRKLQVLTSQFNVLHKKEQALKEECLQLKTSLEQLMQDPVTKVLAWVLFEEHLQRGILESGRYQLMLGVLLVEVNNFSTINNALTEEMSNVFLYEIAQKLTGCIRKTDSISRRKDTFFILIEHLSKPELASIVAQRILQALSKPIKINEQELSITVSIGIAIYPIDGEDGASLLRAAEYALQVAREKGKHLYQFYQSKMNAESRRELALYLGLSRENIFKEFSLRFQPLMQEKPQEKVSHHVLAVFAKIIWHHPELGEITQAELFQQAEKQRKLSMITEWGFREAGLDYLKSRQKLGEALLGFSLTIEQLEHHQFIYHLAQIMQEIGFKPEWLLLEISGDFSRVSFEALEKAFNMLKYLKINIVIDQFGVNAIPLRYLNQFTISYLKLDPSLTNDVTTDSASSEMVEAILMMMKHLNIQVIVQNVREQAQWMMLKKLGCDLFQGQLIDKTLHLDVVS